jgi:hypothetical protein
MSWLLNSIPYILAGATIILGLVQLIKEWDECEKLKFPWLRMSWFSLNWRGGALR